MVEGGERTTVARHLRGALARPRPPGPGLVAQRRAVGRLRPGASSRSWYLAHNVTIVTAYLDHRELAERENRVERFFINLVLIRLLYAHALVAAPRLALAWLAPIARWLGDPRRAMTGIFLSVSRVLPDIYPLEGELDDYIADEHTVGRLLDLGVIAPRLTELYRWSADELRIPDVTDLVGGATPAYAWDPHDRGPWTPPPTRLVRAVRRALPPPRRRRTRLRVDKRWVSTNLATRIVNPVVRWAVRHDLAPGSYAILETTGRRSGLPRRTPVGHVIENATVWIVAEHGPRSGLRPQHPLEPARPYQAARRLAQRDRARSRRGRCAGTPAPDGTARKRARRTSDGHRSAQRPHRSRFVTVVARHRYFTAPRAGSAIVHPWLESSWWRARLPNRSVRRSTKSASEHHCSNAHTRRHSSWSG